MRHSTMKLNNCDVTKYALQSEVIDIQDKIVKLKQKNNAKRVKKTTLSQLKTKTGR